ncbi:hypothetical protein [Butyrivibrio sp. YAB3001]|nr:hypothetical protein [Butyrivibrio sp. YAB3001]SFC28520.1 hypothetical protein SAMN02910398_01904 [Butyrivibrio sp. YAB3001]
MSDENTTQTGNKEMDTEAIVECLRHLGIGDETEKYSSTIENRVSVC